MTGMVLVAASGWVLAAFGWIAAWAFEDRVLELEEEADALDQVLGLARQEEIRPEEARGEAVVRVLRRKG